MPAVSIIQRHPPPTAWTHYWKRKAPRAKGGSQCAVANVMYCSSYFGPPCK